MAIPLVIKVFKGAQLVATKAFDRDIIKIGRLASAHVCVDDEKVSRIHSVIEVSSQGTMSITDMGSVEGTHVNGKRINKSPLNFGDEIRVGGTLLRLEAPSAVQALPAEALTNPSSMVSISGAAAGAIATAAVQLPIVPLPQTHSDSFEGLGETLRFKPTKRQAASGPLGLEIRLWWDQQLLDNRVLRRGQKETFSVGSAASVDFVMDDAWLGTPSFRVIESDGASFSVHFTEKMSGDIEHQGEKKTLAQLVESGKAVNENGTFSLVLGTDDCARVDLGGIVLEALFQPLARPVLVPLSERIDFAVLNIFLVTFFLGALFVISALNRDAEGDDFADELSGNQARIAKLIVKPPDVQKNRFLEKLNKQKEDVSAQKARKGDEGKAGKADAPKRNTRMSAVGQTNSKDAAKELTRKIFSSGGGIAAIFKQGGLGGDLHNAMGGILGATTGASYGLGGYGLKGSGTGGGGTGGPIGIGGVGTHGRASGNANYGVGVGLGEKKKVDIGITSSEPVIMGSLDKELIRQVIRRNIGQIRYCYESQLNRFPKLNGKIAVKFVISGNGSVASAAVAMSTADNAELESCLVGRVRTWEFPKPKGGGVVVVTYPFVFKQSGE